MSVLIAENKPYPGDWHV